VSAADPSGEGRRQVEITSRTTRYEGRYRLVEYVFSCDSPTGRGRITGARREVFERGDSAAALIHDVERDVIILAEQFRIATHAAGPGYMLEAMAGSLEPGEDPEACIRREMMEEVGYRAGELRLVARLFASPGASSERMFLYYAPVRTSDLIDPQACGLAAEAEDIRRVELSRKEFLRRVRSAQIADAKLMTLGLWLLSSPRRGAPARPGPETGR
jgi:nudix-type nucleoside diphosphatase (YffH/AdpP family)